MNTTNNQTNQESQTSRTFYFTLQFHNEFKHGIMGYYYDIYGPLNKECIDEVKQKSKLDLSKRYGPIEDLGIVVLNWQELEQES